MRLLVDECVPDPTRIVLRQAGHKLITVEDLGQTGAANGEVLSRARQQRVVLVTVDRGFGNLRAFPLGTHQGIVVLKVPRPEDYRAVHRHLLDALTRIPKAQLTGSLLIVDRNKFRLRRPRK